MDRYTIDIVFFYDFYSKKENIEKTAYFTACVFSTLIGSTSMFFFLWISKEEYHL